MTSKPTIWQALAAKLGREPTNAEAKAECLRILNEAHIERDSRHRHHQHTSVIDRHHQS